MQSFQHIFRREGIKAQVVEGDSFHRYNRLEMRAKMKEAEASGNKHYSHFGPYSNLLGELEALFKGYGESGGGRVRKYVHDAGEALGFGDGGADGIGEGVGVGRHGAPPEGPDRR